MPISDYYRDLRSKIGQQLIFSPSVAAIIRNAKAEILLQRPGQGDYWSLPAGSIELGETPAEAMVREVWEETGLHVTPERLLGVFGGKDFRFTYPDGNRVEYNIFVFGCTVVGGSLFPRDGESLELTYFPRTSLPRLALPYPDKLFMDYVPNALFEWDPDFLSTLT